MYVLMATTKGDELVRPTTKALCASEDEGPIRYEIRRCIALRDAALNGLDVYTGYSESDVYDRYEVVEVRTV